MNRTALHLSFLFAMNVFFVVANISVAQQSRYEFEQMHMAVPIRITLYAESEEAAQHCAKIGFAEFEKINMIMSDYDRGSEITLLTQRNDEQPGVWLPISEELFTILQTSRRYTELTGGAFDVSVAPIVQLWRRAKRIENLPPPARLEKAKTLVGSQLWELREGDAKEIRLHKKGMRFDFGGIAKGYAIDLAFEKIRETGIQSVLIDAGGDMRLGSHPNGGWNIGIAPMKREGESVSSPLLNLRLENISLATSGDTFQYWEYENKRYSHIIDPRSGEPLSDSSIVTVLCESATEADALASALSVLGVEKGLALLDRWPLETPAPQAMIVSRETPPNIRYTKQWDYPKKE